MMAIILAGGKGTRLHPLTMVIPKPLLPLGNVAIIEVVIRQLAASGFDRVVLTLGHMAHLFVATLGANGSRRFGVTLEYCIEEEALGTAGALRLVKRPEREMLVMNGDLLTNVSYAELVQQHVATRAMGTIAVSQREVRIDYGVVKATRGGELSKYAEKPSIHFDVSMGINVLSRRCLEFVPKSGRFDMPDLMLAIRNAGRRVMVYRTSSYWQDIGRFDDYQRASADFDAAPERFLPRPS